MGFNSFSQNAIPKDSVVILTETQARAIATDLVKYDAAKQIIKLQEARIKNFEKKEIKFNDKLDIKDSIIYKQKSLKETFKKALEIKKPFEIHGYVGVQSTRFTIINPTLYTNIMFEFTKFNIGAQYFLQPNNPSGYSIILEYKLF